MGSHKLPLANTSGCLHSILNVILPLKLNKTTLFNFSNTALTICVITVIHHDEARFVYEGYNENHRI